MGLRKIGIKLVNKFYGKRLIDKLKKEEKCLSSSCHERFRRVNHFGVFFFGGMIVGRYSTLRRLVCF